MADIKPPAKNPCGSCPYRKDVPSGIWDPSEYEKLREYDRPTQEQPIGVFLCHRQDGRACAGWVGVHDMDESLGIRLACSMGGIDDVEPFVTYETDTPLFGSGIEAAAHGMKDIKNPGPDAQRVMDKMRRQSE